MAGKIFINYRRDDSAAHALGVAQYLEGRFGARNVFIDIDRIRAGESFPKVLAEKLRKCKVLVAVIGPSWLTLQDEQGRRRIDDADDWVRLEIEQALARKITVIPVLVGGASLPKKDDLPSQLHPLLEQQAVRLTTSGFRHEMAGLVADIRAIDPWDRGRRIASWLAGAVVLAAVGGALLHYAPAMLARKPPVETWKSSAPSVVQAGMGTLRSSYKDWQVRCSPAGNPPKEQCAVVQKVVAEDRPLVNLTVVALRSIDNKVLLRMMTPAGVLMSAGVGLRIDDHDVGRSKFLRCMGETCIAEASIDDGLLRELQTGKVATFIIFESEGQGIGLPLALDGFAAALASLPN